MENVDTTTGEVFESTATVSVNGGGSVPLKDLEKAVDRLEQMTLFEGHKVDMVEQKIKAGSLGSMMADSGKRIPRLYETKYFLIQAQATKVIHSNNKDFGLVKEVVYEAGYAKEIDEFTAQGFIGRR